MSNSARVGSFFGRIVDKIEEIVSVSAKAPVASQRQQYCNDGNYTTRYGQRRLVEQDLPAIFSVDERDPDMTSLLPLMGDQGGIKLNETESEIGEELIEVDEAEDWATCQTLVDWLSESLSDAKQKYIGCAQLLVPCDLMSKIARDIIRMSEMEPCGLRGALICIYYENANISQRIDVLQIEPDSVATFELFLTLKQDTTSWLSIRHMFSFKNCLRRLIRSKMAAMPMTNRHTVVISPGYTLVKKKLYRSSAA